MLNILVCIKQVLDPDAPVSSFKINNLGKNIIAPPGTMPVLNPFDENALEAALKIKDVQDVKITVLSMGHNLAKPVFLKAVASGADEVIIIDDPSFESTENSSFQNLDSFTTASVLAEAIKKHNKYDIILCGRQAADTDAGLVGPGVAEILGIPLITMAKKIEVARDKLRIEQITSDGYNVLEAALPVLITVGNEMGDLRYPSTKNLMAAKKKKPVVWQAADFNINVLSLTKIEVVDMHIPVKKVDCKMIEAPSPEEKATKLAMQLSQDGVI
ncbi:MAG: hypothetical protein APF81_01255 [Desulfosporosinus sp. BRH_c37]|nr:MAG: hypothetical protein APF81_01255 [Desulfosporosinus sp. BRH_c37]